MRLVGPAGFKKKYVASLLAVLVIIALPIIYYMWQGSDSNNKVNPQQNIAATNNKLKVDALSSANKSLDEGNYAQAESTYVFAATASVNNNDYASAEQTMLTAEKKIPKDQLPWSFYDSLSVIAKKLNDTATEKASLQQALSKAKISGSDAPASVIPIYQERLKQLGIKS